MSAFAELWGVSFSLDYESITWIRSLSIQTSEISFIQAPHLVPYSRYPYPQQLKASRITPWPRSPIDVRSQSTTYSVCKHLCSKLT